MRKTIYEKMANHIRMATTYYGNCITSATRATMAASTTIATKLTMTSIVVFTTTTIMIVVSSEYNYGIHDTDIKSRKTIT